MLSNFSYILLIMCCSFLSIGQNNHPSIHQEHSELYGSTGVSPLAYEDMNEPAALTSPKSSRNCNLNKYVFGWHPYWSNGLQANYNWNLLSDMSYFSYEVNALTGNANTTHGFATAQAVTDALANGVRVNLCVTLFSDHATFFNNPSSKQTLISNLISLIQARQAHGVNIDFESMASSLSADYTAFMIDLSTQMKAAIPNCQISVALHAVDWSNFYDIPALEPHIDLFCVMGYDYYWTGSSIAGPNDPLYHFNYNAGYNRTLSRSTTYYESRGVPKEKLILGLPYYGREWPVNGFNLPATATGNGQAAFYRTVKNNASGHYAAANRNVDPISRSVHYNFLDGTTMKQHFISEEEELGERMDFTVKRGLAGIGIWALGYDDGYQELWNEIESHLTDCSVTPCSGEIWDMGGGPLTSYYSQEDYSFTLAPPGASSVSLTFSEFDLEANFDYLYIYDGATTSAPQVPGSPFTGGTSPGALTSTSGALTVRFTSDNATVSSGYRATYTCLTDIVPPITTIDATNDWKTTDFTVDFIDEDNVGGTGVDRRFYHTGHFDGVEWRANENNGFLNDEFNLTALHADWQVVSGSWSSASTTLEQTDELLANTNVYAPLNQSLSNLHVYHFRPKIGGTGTNRRAGLHFFCDDPLATNRGNSYFVWLRVDDNAVQFYKVVNDNFGSPVINVPYTVNAEEWYDVKVSYDRITGEVVIHINDEYVASWTDTDPIATGEFISFRSGNALVEIDEVRVYRSRFPSQTISVGDLPTDDVQFQNPTSSQPSGRVFSLVRDSALNLSGVDIEYYNVDWTPPLVLAVNDGNGMDADTIYTATTSQVDGNWSGEDPNSDITEYSYAIGSTPFGDDIHPWTSNGTSSDVTVVSGNLVVDTWYYLSVKALNGAGLIDSLSSDGFRILNTTIGLGEQVLIPQIYPNPARTTLQIHLGAKIEVLEVYDAAGRLMLRSEEESVDAVLDVEGLSTGIYTARIYASGQVIEARFVKE